MIFAPATREREYNRAEISRIYNALTLSMLSLGIFLIGICTYYYHKKPATRTIVLPAANSTTLVGPDRALNHSHSSTLALTVFSSALLLGACVVTAYHRRPRRKARALSSLVISSHSETALIVKTNTTTPQANIID